MILFFGLLLGVLSLSVVYILVVAVLDIFSTKQDHEWLDKYHIEEKK